MSAKPEAGRRGKQGRARCFDPGQQVHRIDTRGAADVNLDKYDERIDKLVDAGRSV
ncbi:MAG: hypothetical protein ACLT14_00750 [Butyricicoccaceae bacterium]